MLSRVANSLYWAGRYIERSDHTSRYLNINYFSSLDTPHKIAQPEEFMLESLVFMSGANYEGPIEEKSVLRHIGFDKDNPISLINTVTQARVNAHGTRHLLSTEVWEAINKFYHFVNNYSQEVFVTTGLFDLTTKLNELCSIIREKIIRTLLHDEVWALLMLGIHLERAFQMIRLINTKLYDIEKIKEQTPHDKNVIYEWATLLRCAETYDMSKKYYRKVPNSKQTLEFLLLNRSNPKSLISNVDKVNSYINRISDKKGIEPEMIEFKIGKLLSTLTYLTMEDIEEDRTAFILDSFDQLNGIGASFEKDYLFF